MAVYNEQLIPEYQGNPLIEALPPIWTRTGHMRRDPPPGPAPRAAVLVRR